MRYLLWKASSVNLDLPIVCGKNHCLGHESLVEEAAAIDDWAVATLR